MPNHDLKTLATTHGTDKWSGHRYAQHYDRHFSPWRSKPVRLLEIGIGGYMDPKQGGQSLRMWKEFFAQGSIVGLDLYDKSRHAEDRIRIYQGSQTDVSLLERIVRECGPFDLIVDDGSHCSKHVIASFEYLFPHGLAEDGIYAVEDLQTSYWRSFGGATSLDATHTSMAYFKRLCDGLNFKEWHRPRYRPNYVDLHVVAIHFYHNLVFVQKGRNDEESNFVNDNRVPFKLRRPQLLLTIDEHAKTVLRTVLSATPQGTRLFEAIRDRRARREARL
jgi:hypothetical protein